MKNLENVFFPTNLANLNNQFFFSLLLYFLSKKTHKINQISNLQTQSHVHRFTKHKDIQQLFCHSFTFPLQTQDLIQNTFNKPKVLTHLNPNLQTQENPNGKNPI